MKKQLKNGMVLLLLLCMAMNIFASVRSEAASKNKKAGSAFARAVASGKIAFKNKDYVGITDVNGDGVKELVTLTSFIGNCGDLTVWKYVNGKVSKVEKGWCGFPIYFNKNKKIFWSSEGTDGTYMVGYKIAGKKFKKVESFACNIGSSGKPEAERTVNEKTKKISQKEFKKIYNDVLKKDMLHMKSMTEAKLIQKLASMK